MYLWDAKTANRIATAQSKLFDIINEVITQDMENKRYFDFK
jgi:hypothetical protein